MGGQVNHMKINEVETLAGITKKNIRFYEQQGLLSPVRNKENGYRDYGDADVEILRRIKLFRKLGVPIEEIRQMFSGSQTVADCMRRHLVSLERDRRNLEQALSLCNELQNLDIPAEQLDCQEILSRMEQMEKSGTAFSNRQKQDVRMLYVAPVAVTIVMVALMAAFAGIIIWAFFVSPEDAPPLWFIMIIVAVLAAVAFGVVLALYQRIKEIMKGEVDDAKNY